MKKLVFSLNIFFASILLIVLTLFMKNGIWGINNFLIFKIRFNKMLVLTLGSFCVGMASFLLQKFTKNNIVDTGLFGISSFNILIVAILIIIFSVSSTTANLIYKYGIPFISIIFSILIVGILWIISKTKTGSSKKTLVLSGLIFNYLFIVIAYALLQKLEPNRTDLILQLGVGDINEGYPSWILGIMTIIILITIIWYFSIHKKIQILNIDEKLSKNVGNQNKIVSIQIIIICGIISAIGFACLGSVSFLGIISGNLATKIFRRKWFSSLISGVIAIIISSISYLLIDSFFGMYYPIGITIAIIGAPYFIFQVVRGKYD